MAAFDANQGPPVLNKEKSAFDQDDGSDDGGDLDSDIDGDGPQMGQIGMTQMANSVGAMGLMSQRQDAPNQLGLQQQQRSEEVKVGNMQASDKQGG